MTLPKYARGARVVVRPPDDVPELVEIAGQTGLVVDTTHPEHPEATVLSLDVNPGAIVLVDQAWLAPVDDKPCVTLDPRCCALAPCAGCLVMFQAHLRAALTAAGLTREQGLAFVTEWNAQREKGRAQSLDLVRQARAYAVEQSDKRASEPAAQLLADLQAVHAAEPVKQEQVETLNEGAAPVVATSETRPPNTASPQEAAITTGDVSLPARSEGDVDRAHREPPPALPSQDSPQILPSEGVEKKGSTKRRKPAKTAVPSTEAEAPSPGSSPAAAAGVPGDGEAAG